MARCGCPCHNGSKIPGFATSPDVTGWLDALIACERCRPLHAPAHLTFASRQQFRAGAVEPLDFTNDDTLDDGG